MTDTKSMEELIKCELYIHHHLEKVKDIVSIKNTKNKEFYPENCFNNFKIHNRYFHEFEKSFNELVTSEKTPNEFENVLIKLNRFDAICCFCKELGELIISPHKKDKSNYAYFMLGDYGIEGLLIKHKNLVKRSELIKKLFENYSNLCINTIPKIEKNQNTKLDEHNTRTNRENVCPAGIKCSNTLKKHRTLYTHLDACPNGDDCNETSDEHFKNLLHPKDAS